MAVKLKWPWLGLAIPCFLIGFIGYCGHYFVLANFLSRLKQLWFQCSLSMIWISYYLAIYTNPGSPNQNFKPPKHEWKNYCKRCQNFKPVRSHHCKSCKQCVLMMDHHCPWTMNCVGYHNFPHFMRFLFWILATTCFLLFQLVPRIIYLFKHRNLPSYMFHKSELVFLSVLTPLAAFVLLTVSLLFCRCLLNQIFGGKSQIESWELERLEGLFFSDKLMPQLIDNAWEVYPESRTENNEEQALKMIESRARFHEVVNFPYDLDPWSNALQLLGSPLTWLLPFGKPSRDGIVFCKNEIADYERDASIEDIILSLPWPPDGGRSNRTDVNEVNNIESVTKNGEQLVRKKLIDNDESISRKQWQNNWGENLEDFGVDVDAEQDNF